MIPECRAKISDKELPDYHMQGRLHIVFYL
jgi:hypothetical protein